MGQAASSRCSPRCATTIRLVSGIRRIVEFDADPRALTLSHGFIEGVNLLEKFGMHFEINVNHTQMDIVREFGAEVSSERADDPRPLRQAGHQGRAPSSSIRDDVQRSRPPSEPLDQALGPAALRPAPNWSTEADLRPYIEATLEAFGPERTIYAGDYPILLQSTTLTEWVDVLDEAFADLGLSEAETRRIYRDNAIGFYRLQL